MTHQEVLDRWPILRPWFAGFPEELHKAYTVRELPEQYLIHQKGSPLERVGVLCDGGLRVVNEFNTGNIFQIEHTAPVDIIGDVTLLARQDRVSVTIETLVPSTILFFPGRILSTGWNGTVTWYGKWPPMWPTSCTTPLWIGARSCFTVPHGF